MVLKNDIQTKNHYAAGKINVFYYLSLRALRVLRGKIRIAANIPPRFPKRGFWCIIRT